ncbi:ribonuclease III [Schleiferia thermophila]|uniref:ribonuclease III n=1 Tax=Schleiferia thermophila TaxID=884107 RepID=UPI003EF03CB3
MVTNWIKSLSGFITVGTDKSLKKALKKITGITPLQLTHYKIALHHRSLSKPGQKLEDYERLEFLGDAILGAVITSFLYHRFPQKKEGFLSEVRAKIVNRNHLHQISINLNIPSLIRHKKTETVNLPKSFYGDVLEALIGAIYLDRGYKKAEKFILRQIMAKHISIDEIVQKINSHKAYLHEWAQKSKKHLTFQLIDSWGSSHHQTFEIGCYINNELISSGTGLTKKSAEEEAAKIAIRKLNLS